MAGQFLRAATAYVCAYCGAPLAMAAQGMKAWRVGSQFVCNEFCADGISPDLDTPKAALAAVPIVLTQSLIVFAYAVAVSLVVVG
jgi:hypothetical protein